MLRSEQSNFGLGLACDGESRFAAETSKAPTVARLVFRLDRCRLSR